MSLLLLLPRQLLRRHQRMPCTLHRVYACLQAVSMFLMLGRKKSSSLILLKFVEYVHGCSWWFSLEVLNIARYCEASQTPLTTVLQFNSRTLSIHSTEQGWWLLTSIAYLSTIGIQLIIIGILFSILFQCIILEIVGVLCFPVVLSTPLLPAYTSFTPASKEQSADTDIRQDKTICSTEWTKKISQNINHHRDRELGTESIQSRVLPFASVYRIVNLPPASRGLLQQPRLPQQKRGGPSKYAQQTCIFLHHFAFVSKRAKALMHLMVWVWCVAVRQLIYIILYSNFNCFLRVLCLENVLGLAETVFFRPFFQIAASGTTLLTRPQYDQWISGSRTSQQSWQCIQWKTLKCKFSKTRRFLNKIPLQPRQVSFISM